MHRYQLQTCVDQFLRCVKYNLPKVQEHIGSQTLPARLERSVTPLPSIPDNLWRTPGRQAAYETYIQRETKSTFIVFRQDKYPLRRPIRTEE